MPFSVKLCYTDRPPEEGLCTIYDGFLELNWWDAYALKKDERFEYIPGYPGESDYVGELSRDELIEMHEGYKPKATSGVYVGGGWPETIEKKMKKLERVIYKDYDKYNHVYVVLFQWESGM